MAVPFSSFFHPLFFFFGLIILVGHHKALNRKKETGVDGTVRFVSLHDQQQAMS